MIRVSDTGIGIPSSMQQIIFQDFVQLDSPCMTGIDWLAQNAAGKICIIASPNIQDIYPEGNREVLMAHIKELILKFGNHNGGFAYMPYTDPHAIGVDRETEKCGVDVVKTPYCGEVQAHRQIVADCPVPLVAAGGPRAEPPGTADVASSRDDSISCCSTARG